MRVVASESQPVARADALNKIAVDVKAYIDGDSTLGIEADAITIKAMDVSTIGATAVGASLAASFAGTAAVSVSIAVSLAENEIHNSVEAYIQNADTHVLSRDGDIRVEAIEDASISATSAAASLAVAFSGVAGISVSGAGADATNIILTETHAFIENSQIDSASDVIVNAESTALIDALIISAAAAIGGGGTVGIGASVGASTANNFIGYNSNGTRTPAEIHAYINNSQVDAADDITVTAVADDEIDAFVGAISAAIGAGTVGVSGAGAGVDADNMVATEVHSYISNSTGTGIEAGGVDQDIASDEIDFADVIPEAPAHINPVGTFTISDGELLQLADTTNVLGYLATSVYRYVGGGTLSLDLSTVTDSSYFLGTVAVPATDWEALPQDVIDTDELVSLDTGEVYRYTGSQTRVVPLSTVDFANDSAWELVQEVQVTEGDRIRVDGGDIYRYTGDDASLLLALIDYANDTDWSPVDTTTAGDVLVRATDDSTIDAYVGAMALAGSAGAVGGSISFSVSLASSTITNDVQAYTQSADVTTTSGDMTIEAIENATVDVSSEAGSVAASISLGFSAAGGGAEASVLVNTTTKAFVQGGELNIDGDLTVNAESTATADANTGSLSVSLGLISFAAGGSSVSAVVTPRVEAYVQGADVTADDIDITASATPKADTEARGFNVSTGLSMGVSVATAYVNADVYAHAGGSNSTITADNLTVDARNLLPSSGRSADADATGSSGGLLLGVDATLTGVTNESSARSYVASNTTLDIADDTSITARNDTRNVANSSSDAFGLVAAGITESDITTNTSTDAYLGSNVDLTGANLLVTATGFDDNYAETTAGSGGVAAGASAAPNIDAQTSVIAELRNSSGTTSSIDLTTRGAGDFVVGADYLGVVNTRVITSSAGLISGSGAESSSDVDTVVRATVGDNAEVSAQTFR